MWQLRKMYLGFKTACLRKDANKASSQTDAIMSLKALWKALGCSFTVTVGSSIVVPPIITVYATKKYPFQQWDLQCLMQSEKMIFDIPRCDLFFISKYRDDSLECVFVFWVTNSNLESSRMYDVLGPQQGRGCGSSGGGPGNSITACKKVTLAYTTFFLTVELEHSFNWKF